MGEQTTTFFTKTRVLITMILLIGLYRLLPHPFNVTPVMAMALFAGTYFDKKIFAFVVPLAAMLLSDIFIGFHNTMIFVYGAMALSVLLGFVLRKGVTTPKVIGASVLGSVLFFIITNFGVWLVGSFYPKDFAGLMACYTAAIPFFERTLFGDLFFNAILFVSYGYMLQKKIVPQVAQSSSH